MKPLTYLMLDLENLQPAAEDIERLRGNDARLWIFRGPHQSKFDEDLVVALQPLGDRVRHIKSSKNGKNALDFHVAFCLGQAQQQNSSAGYPARYIVVTKDGGFDSLFDYMRTLGCQVGRAHSIPEALTLADALLADPQLDDEESSPDGGPKGVAITRDHSVEDARLASFVEEVATNPIDPAEPKVSPTKSTKAKRNAMAPEDIEKVIAFLRANPKNRPANRKALQHHIVSVLSNKVTVHVSQAVIKVLEGQKVLTFNGEKIAYKLPKARK